jgi:hypothetical protein
MLAAVESMSHIALVQGMETEMMKYTTLHNIRQFAI